MHERIWAPWRLAYIQGSAEAPAATGPLLEGADPICFLCRGAASQPSRANLVVHRGRQTLTVLNRYPYNNGHLLVAPLRHWGHLAELPAEVHAEVAVQLSRLVELLQRHLRAEGFNIGLNLGRVAGAGLPGHLHWHVVPRWNGDANFMPTVGDTKVISQSLEAVWDLLSGELARS